MFPVEINLRPIKWKYNSEKDGTKVSLFVTKEKKYIQKHYITIRYPVKSGHCGSPEKK
jgi:hypothetical protein|tara:strand:+ start:490 stop:663 length:174 start_codon:yes stop_codon:yes gene_type:complete